MTKLPTVEEFTESTPPEEDLDGFCAWKNFGGLDLEAAYEKFLTAPEVYQEDFMFMGARAFRFYFPVIDRYLRTVEGPQHQFGEEAWILGCVMRQQFQTDARRLASIQESALALCEHILDELERTPPGPDASWTTEEIVKSWLEAWSWVMPKPQRKKGDPRRRAKRPWPKKASPDAT